MAALALKTVTGNYGHTKPLKDGSVTSDEVAFDHIDVPVIINALGIIPQRVDVEEVFDASTVKLEG